MIEHSLRENRRRLDVFYHHYPNDDGTVCSFDKAKDLKAWSKTLGEAERAEALLVTNELHLYYPHPGFILGHEQFKATKLRHRLCMRFHRDCLLTDPAPPTLKKLFEQASKRDPRVSLVEHPTPIDVACAKSVLDFAVDVYACDENRGLAGCVLAG